MESIDTIKWIVEVLVPIVSAIVGYIVGKRKRDNDFISDLQTSINLLSEKNAELIEKVIELNDQVVSLKRENAELKAEIASLNTKLDGVKTITRVKKND